MTTLFYVVLPGYETKPLSKATAEAAGIDIYCPSINSQFIQDFDAINPEPDNYYCNIDAIGIPSLARVLIPTGISINIRVGTYIDVATKSGKFKKTGLKVGSHVIDSDYTGQIYISLFNTSKEATYIHPGDAIAQLIHKEYISDELHLLKDSRDSRMVKSTSRGSAGFGALDVK